MEDFQLSLTGLQAIAQRSGGELSKYLAKQIWNPQDRQAILSILSQLLLDKECTLLIGRQLRPLLLDLLERNAESIKAGGQVNHDLHERLCVAMSRLVNIHPDVLPFALRYFQKASPVFQRLFLESCDSSTVRYGRRRMKLRDLMEAAYRFLQQDKSYFREMWDWSVCVPLLRSHDLAVRWYTAHCLSLVTSMTDENKQTLLKRMFSADELIHFKLQLLDELQSHNIDRGLLLVNPDNCTWHREKSQQYTQCQIVSGDLSPRVVPVCGVMLAKKCLKNSEKENTASKLVLVESFCKHLHSLALAVAYQNAVLLEGPIGCGKTALVEHLAAVTERLKPPDILKVQLGDQTDSKMLLGMYRCTDIPGEFVWQPGTLTQAVTNGHWILLEDIDYAPLDVISVLIPVLENGELLIPGRGDCIKVAPGFQLFATRRLLSSGTGTWYRPQNSHAALLDKYWTKIHLDNMTRGELKEVLQKLYPSLGIVTDRLLEIYIQLTGDKHQPGCNFGPDSQPETQGAQETKLENRRLNLEGRGLSLRDLLKWCNRIVHNFDATSPSTALNIFHEALDCFTAMLSKPAVRLKMAEVIGSKLNLSKKQAEFYCQLYKPAIVLREMNVTVGRVEVLRKQTETIYVQREKITFAATQPSSVLIEQLAVCVNKGEPVLLVGETGTGKTSTVQYLAHVAGQRLRVVNMNQQSDTADLLGGYKPVDHKLIWLPLREGFEDLFTQTFSKKQNITFLGHVQTCYRQKRWHDLLKLMQHVTKSAMTKVQKCDTEFLLKEKWESFSLRLNQAQQQMRMTENAVLFAFVEGTLAQAVKKGEWILLDEINLAAAETLECLCGLLEGSSGSLVLLDRGDTEPLVRHSDFRLFACMNPATDVGKRNLPPGIRNRFTELYVEELENESDLQILITDYLKGLNLNKAVVQGIISFYLSIRKKANAELVDGTGHRPHYSLRTLCRALRFAAANPCCNIQRSLYEGFCLGFLTQLDRASHSTVQNLITRHIIQGNIKNLLKQPYPKPCGGEFLQIEGYWIPVGDMDPVRDETYILTSSVVMNLRDLTRVVSAGTHPVLIQGETSVGKTSLIRWLACATGNHCVRINNHEHTDIQEYIGCYTSDASGKLVFQEGVLIDAMRKGYWIILDELNLAPTDVLEALNRLLDDNRELFITETQEVVKAHPRFMLFATQNPPGIYGGRKVLSRAFRNRFVELHFDELPSTELETILHKRCSLPPSYASRLVAVMLDLQSHRRGSSVFAGKYGFITLRDLFRWADRYRLSEQTEKDYDWLQHLANDGFMLLAGRVRKQEEVDVIQQVIEKRFKKKIDLQTLFSKGSVERQLSGFQSSVVDCNFSHIVWTQGMRRLAILVGRALEFNEPILLVGDTGCGKTTICQIFAALSNQTLYSVNCHQHMETSDFLGGLRPVRNRSKDDNDGVECSKLFEWHDGPLVLAMKEDGFFLMDEISLADDSVLERLNSVLEVEKILVLAEKGSAEEDDEVELLTAGKKFRILATMNPGGDFGKKELSPALRNRFTEIWCPQSNDRPDLVEIIKHNLHQGLFLGFSDSDIANLMMDFIEWLTNQDFGRRCISSIRDILAWVNFMNVMVVEKVMSEDEPYKSPLSAVMAFIHAACLVYIDSLGSGATYCSSDSALSARNECMRFLREKLSSLVNTTEDVEAELNIYDHTMQKKITWTQSCFGIPPFYIPKGPSFQESNVSGYALDAGTTSMNAQRLLRALQLNKPILLEGSPGVGKTSLVTALAKASGNTLVRINLSEQTDVTDLFGTDLPVEGGKGGEFAWRDGPLLSALKSGHWIVLDELNLASQSVLEGLNACFDHRAEVYIPELGMSFPVQHKKTKIFGCQNPFHQGGGRKGLPRSFLNRFTLVYVDQLSTSDMEFIANTLFPAINKIVIAKMVAFNNQLDKEVMVERKWGHRGGPWEFNLRDLFRWCQLMLEDQSSGGYDPSQHVFLVYGERMRTKEDREKVASVYKEVFGCDNAPYLGTRQFHITLNQVQVGYSVLPRSSELSSATYGCLSLLHHSLQSIEPIMKCVQMNWMVILVGPAAAGKTSLIQLLALLTGNRLKVMAMNSAMDTTELLGGFEQTDINRPWQELLENVGSALTTLVRDCLLATDVSPDDTENLLRAWSSFNINFKPKSIGEGGRGITTNLLNKLEELILLIQRSNIRLNSFSKADFAAIVENFHCFKEQLLQSVEGQSTGTFEWVDGMLVHALQSGDWLLMDNVNFCSSSVLDRLNALLEPGGVLTMTERGVVEGATPTIKPHPNFRLFLSMDPSHGEISRAMRNRGVEVYISGETNGAFLDPLDVKTLLRNSGLVGDSVCDALVEVHSEIQETIMGSPCSSLSSLLHAATLISQQLQRGVVLGKAFLRACSEAFVFIQNSPESQKQVKEILRSKISTMTNLGGSLLALGEWPVCVPSAQFSSDDAILSSILRDGQILVYTLNKLSLRNSRTFPLTLQDLQLIAQSSRTDNLQFNAVQLESHWLDDPDVIQPSIQLVTEKATSSDWMLRVRWLSHLAKNLPAELDQIRAEIDAGAHALGRLYSSSLLKETCTVMKRLQSSIADSNGIPLDARWNMQLLNKVTNSVSFEKGREAVDILNSLANRAILLTHRVRQAYVETNRTKKLKQTSTLRIAAEFHKDPSVHQNLPHPVVAHLIAFFELWDMLVCECLEYSQTSLTDDAADKVAAVLGFCTSLPYFIFCCCFIFLIYLAICMTSVDTSLSIMKEIYQALCCLQWRDRFRTVTENVSIDSGGLAVMSFHWNWVVKHTLSHIPQIFLHCKQQRLFQEVQSVSMHVSECLSSSSGAPDNVKLLQNTLGRPLPYKESSVVQAVQKLKALCVALDTLELRPVNGDGRSQQELCTLKAACSAGDIKSKILQAWGLILQANHQDAVNTDNLIASIESQCADLKRLGVVFCPTEIPQDDSSATQISIEELTLISSKVQMWPGMEYLMLMWQYKVTADLLAHFYYARKNLQSDLHNFVSFCLKHTPVSPEKFRAHWHLIQQPELSSGSITLLWSELAASVFSSFWNSTITTDPDYWSSWNLAPSGEGKMLKTLMEPSVKGPGILNKAVFSKCFCEVLTSSNKAIPWDVNGLPLLLSSHVSLGEWVERVNQLQDLSSVLWSNMALSSAANFRSTDSKLQGLLLYHLFVALKDIVPKSLQEEFLQYCDHLPTKDLSAYHYIQDVMREWMSQNRLPEDTLKLWLACLQQFYEDVDGMVQMSETAQRGVLWVNMGLLQLNIWLPQTLFDPAVKRECKLKYAQEELNQLECEWKTRNLSSSLLTGKELDDATLKKHLHPHISLLLQRIQKLKKQIHNLSRKQAYRPKSPTYNSLYQDVHHYVASIAKASSVQDFAARLMKPLNGKGPKSRQGLQNLLSEEVTWQQSHHTFRKRLSEEYSLYPDLVTPLQSAILQMQHGMRLIASELYIFMNSSLIPPNKITNIVTSLLAFPSISESFPTYFSHADSLCSVGSLDFLKSLKKLSQKYPCKDRQGGRELSCCLTKEQLLVNSLLFLRSHVLSKGEMDQKSLKLFRHICQAINNEWDEQERLGREKEQQESSLYKYKSKSHGTGLSEEEEEEREFHMRFPLYEKDFADITSQPSLEGQMETETTEDQESDLSTLMSQSSMKTVMLVHQQVCLGTARSLWYRQSPPQHQAKHYLGTFLSCYQSSAALIEHLYPLVDADLNDHLLGSQLLVSTVLQNTISGNITSNLILQHESPYDFYQHPNIQQIQQCRHVLKQFATNVNKLLEEWPEHPALLQVLVVIERIQGFPLSSPLSKFLYGLEILLAKSQDWEEIASRTLSLGKNLEEITQLIIQWRKLELNCWSINFDNVVLRHAQNSARHWFSIYQMVEKYLQSEQEQEGGEELTLQSIVKTLQAFIEGSSLGEFHERLHVLLVFHCHILLAPQVEAKVPLCSIFWHLYNYYKQFSSSVQAKITESRQPLEKELKDFVKISRWNDVSFWSVKQSVEKTHRTLFKYMKKFESALCAPCYPALIESVQEEPSDAKGNMKQHLNLVFCSTLTRTDNTPLTSGEGLEQEFYATESLQWRLPKLTKKMKKLCGAFIKKNTVPSLFESLNDFTEGIIDSLKELQNLSVDQTAEKDKQKSEAKHILMQKQRALSELFKSLSKTGLSYRKGLHWKQKLDIKDILSLHPLDLHSAVSVSNTTLEADAGLLADISLTWDGCQKYFYRSLARNSRLDAAFATPSKELGLGNIERCKGFTGHLLKVLVKQRSSLTALTEQWVTIRNLVSCVEEISSRTTGPNDYRIALPPQEGVHQWLERLQHLAMQCTMILEQLSWFFECCPTQNTSESNMHSSSQTASDTCATITDGNILSMEPSYPSPVAANLLPPACTMRKTDQAWQQLSSRVANMLTQMKATKTSVDDIKQQSSDIQFYSWKDFETCAAGVDVMQQVFVDLREVESQFVLPEVEMTEAAQHMPLLKSLHYIREEIRTVVREFTVWKTHLHSEGAAKRNRSSDERFVEDYSEKVESTIKALLCAVQSLVQQRSKQESEEGRNTEGTDEEQTVEMIQQGLITSLLTEDLSRDLKALHVQNIISSVSELLGRLKTYGEDCIRNKYMFFNQCCSFLVRLLPMLTTYSNLIMFYLTMSLATHRSTGKLLSILASLFTDLAQKGFCLPRELIEDAEGEGATEFHDYEGGGIGEGEGMKDVSEKIENEDQIEDTLQKGQDKEKEDQDSKPNIEQEDNAIEMSEDFDGKMHDGEPKEEEDERSNSDEEEDLDKQMGDLGDNEADKLDERLWGDDDDDLEEEEENDKTETGPGMDMGESELVANDDNQDAGNKNKEQKKQQDHPADDEKDEQREEDGQKEKIHEQIDEREYDENEVDPYHGKQENQQEVEPLDLPDDLNLENEEGKHSGDEEEGEDKNPLDIEEKPMDLANGEDGQTKEEEKSDEVKPEEGQEEVDKETPEDKAEGEENTQEGDKQEEEPSAQDEAEPVEGEEKDSAEKEENALPVDRGLLPQIEDQEKKPDNDEEVLDSAERMEHETSGQTAEDNLQSESAAELAGAASEKDQAKEDHGTGTADASQSEGHESKLMARLASQKQSVRSTQSFKRKPGHTDEERSMGDQSDQVQKRLRTMESSSDMTESTTQPEERVQEADAYEHIKPGAESYDAQTYDAASKEQERTAQPSNEVEEKNQNEDEAMETDLREDEALEAVNVDQLMPEKLTSSDIKTKGPKETELEMQGMKYKEDEELTEERPVYEEKDKPERTTESTIHTAYEFLKEKALQVLQNPDELRFELEQQLAAWQTQSFGTYEEEKAAAEMWQRYLTLTAQLSQQLCEQLRLILEPTQAAKLRGDFRTGKRLNMRKVIPYIASQFRKDKIWLRRTKPSKRQYQICIAIDDSSSMVDNHSKQLAYESLAVIGNALSLLEVGQIAVYSFGETVKLLHPFHEQFSEQSGSKILSLCKFQQKKTLVAQFLESSAHMFVGAQLLSQSINSEIAQLLLIVSDGRGLFVEGKDRVTAAVQKVRNANIFVIFVILDNPKSRDSILDIKVPIFNEAGEMSKIISYMEQFPFPFYIILRDVNALPETLSDALRQWFELVTTSEHS